MASDGGVMIQTIGELSELTKGEVEIVNTYAVAGNFAKKYPELVSEYSKVISRAAQAIIDDPETVANEIATELGVSPEEALRQLKGERFLTQDSPDQIAFMGQGGKPGTLPKLLMKYWEWQVDSGLLVGSTPSLDIVQGRVNSSFLN